MRKVVTGLDANGKSAILYDGPLKSIYHVTDTHVGALKMTTVPDFLTTVPDGQTCVAEIWETTGQPHADDPDMHSEPQPFKLQPDGAGLRVRYHVWGPNLDSSTLHATDTLDVNVIIQGQVTLFLEEGRSVVLSTGDSVILPGNQHGWRAGPEGVSMIGVMQRLAPPRDA
jgi:mannose-6-phosphate isomerase-like protein (cupin superfamily)